MKISKVQWFPRGLHVRLRAFYPPQQWWMVVFTNSHNQRQKGHVKISRFKKYWGLMWGSTDGLNGISDSLRMSFEFNTGPCIFQMAAPSGFTVSPRDQATHSNTHWQSPQWPWPRVCPGKRGDISGSRLPLCDVGRRRPGYHVLPQCTRWHGRYTYIWGKHR